ncbi:hypothetical protein DFS34DRAFT_596046 [Phlyctochytrium arcticum]|nr:hypothetical protein DFS34DRAFT_596046 [Phlyctochytrium arcticum]
MTDVIGMNIRSLSNSPEIVSLIIAYLAEDIMWNVDISQYVVLRLAIDTVWAHETARIMRERLQETQAVLALNHPAYIFQYRPYSKYSVPINGAMIINNPCFMRRLQTTHFADWARYMDIKFVRGHLFSRLFWNHCRKLESRTDSGKEPQERNIRWLKDNMFVIGQTVLDDCQIAFNGDEDPCSVFIPDRCSYINVQQGYQICKNVDVCSQDCGDFLARNHYEYALVLIDTYARDAAAQAKLVNQSLVFGVQDTPFVEEDGLPQVQKWTLFRHTGDKSKQIEYIYAF